MADCPSPPTHPRTQHKPDVRRPVLTALTVALALCACAQRSVSSPTPAHGGVSTPDSTMNALSRVEAASSTSLHVTFSAAVGAPAADDRHYTVTDETGAPLGILAAYVAPDGMSVDLATRPQTARTYTLSVSGVPGLAGGTLGGQKSFTGSEVMAPILSDAVVLSETEILLSFSDPISGLFATLGPEALRRGAYTVAPDAEVTDVRFSRDRGSVIVTISTLKAAAYTVSAPGLLAAPASGAAASLIDPQHNQASLSAPSAIDTAPPILKRVTPLASDRVQLIFSEPLRADAADVSKYLIRDAAGTVLGVSEAALSEFRTAVTLTTTPQVAGAAYTLDLPAVQDRAGNALDPSSSVRFSGFTAAATSRSDTTPPRVAGAISVSANSVLVTFSEAVRGGTLSAENVAHYHITGVEGTGALSTVAVGVGRVTPQSAALDVVSARLQPNGTSVLLTTRAQSDIRYELHVTGVTDLAGNQIAPPERDLDPGKALFTGTPVSGAGTDTDHDGVSDADEQRGWTVAVRDINGAVRRYEVTSDPLLADTDGDGLDDSDELANLTDPRRADTDSDKLSDSHEYNVVFSSPTNADTDGDTLADGAEYSLFASSPLLADTDGDQIRDDVEMLSSLRNPLIADLPAPRIAVDGVDLQLDVNFTATSDAGTRQLESKSVQTTLTQATSTSTERSDSTTSEWFANQSVGASFQETIGDEFKAYPKVTFSQSVTSDTGTKGTAGTTFTEASVRSAQQEYANSLTTDREVTSNDSVTRTVSGASLSVGVTVESQSNVAFTMTNLELTAFMPDPFAPGKLVPIATLVPEGAVATGGVTLGPGSPSRGPIRFTAVQIYAALAEKLMQDPSGLVFKISNYTLSDESRRDMAYVSQSVKERTAEMFIDYGGALPFERSNVATFSDYGADSKPTGVTMKRVMEGILGLTHYDQAEDAGLNAAQLQGSYSTFVDGGVEKLARVRSKTFGSLAEPKRWFVTVNNNGRNVNFREIVVRSGDRIRLAYTEDLDGDGLTRAEEDMYGSSDASADTDLDGVPDIEEVYGPADVTGKRSPRTVQRPDGTTVALISNPASADTDGDGLSDCQEQGIVDGYTFAADGHKIPNLTCAGRMGGAASTYTYDLALDPSNPDTDGDGLSDRTELYGYQVRAYVKTGLPLNVHSDPRKADSDGDGTPDRLEFRLGTDPATPDRDLVLDEDRDGLSNYLEDQGWTVTAETVGGRTVKTVTSNHTLADEDGDGLTDAQERAAGTDPRVADTDMDGLPDGTEVKLGTRPLMWDTDGDVLSDGKEVNSRMVVHVKAPAGTASVPDYVAVFDPLRADADQDGLTDNLEMEAGTDPNQRDTDQDGTDDYFEAITSHQLPGVSKLGTDPLLKDKLILVQLDSADVVGDCDPLAGDNYAEFSGELLVQSGTTTPTHLLYLKLDNQDGLLDDTREGASFTFSDTKVYQYVTEDRPFRLISVGLKEIDLGNDDDPLNNLDDTKYYSDVKNGNYTVEATAADASDTKCKLRFHYSITQRQK